MNYLSEKNHLRNLVLSPERLLITNEEYQKLMFECFPIPGSAITNEDDPIPYSEQCTNALKELNKFDFSQEIEGISITDAYDSEELPAGTIAYHRIWGTIQATSYWGFSTKEFEQNLLSAEKNPSISCHFLHVCSGGGEAWYLDRASETLRSLSKPIYVLVEKYCGSAAYYLACHGKVLKATTQNDIIGCIGSMCSFWNFDKYYEKLGLQKIEVYAKQSPLKNKTYRDLVAGKPEKYINEELNPLAQQFIDEVKLSRKVLSDISEDDPIFQGEIFSGNLSVENKLIDGIVTMPQAIKEANDLGQKWIKKNQTSVQKSLPYLRN